MSTAGGDLYAVIMAGGSGTRFWPASRVRRPKQLLPIGIDEPLIVRTSTRLADMIPPERQFVITSARYVGAVRELLPDVPPMQVVGEPVGRDTAPCIGLAGRLVGTLDPDATVVAMPSDHVIGAEELFREHIGVAREALAARPDAILVFGIEPDRPATGYGYLRQGAVLGEFGGRRVYRLDAFVEKPDESRAREMLAAGGHFWNAGLFAFRPRALAAAYAAHLPAMGPRLDRIARAWRGDEFEQILTAEFPSMQSISIDYGVMEKADQALLLPLPIRWDDVGSWAALERLAGAGDDGNVTEGDTLVLSGTGNIVSARDGLVAVKGVDDLIVVHTPDATLVCRRDDAEGVKQIVEALRERGLERYL